MITALNKLYRWRYLVAIVMTGLIYKAGAGLQPLLGERDRVLLFTLAITLSALNGGIRARPVGHRSELDSSCLRDL